LFRLKFDMFQDAMATPAPYFLLPRAISVVAGACTVWLVYRVTRELFDKTTGLVAAFFIAVAYLHVRDSHFGVTDVPMTALAVAAFLVLSRAVADPVALRRWAIAGAMVGLTASTKYNGGVLAAAGLVAATVATRGRDEPRLVRTIAARALTFLGTALLGFLAGTPFAVLDYPGFFEGLRFNSNHLMTAHGIDLGRGWLYHGVFSLRHGLGAPLLIAGVAGMPILAARSWRKAALVCTFPVLYYFLLGRGATVFVRYMVPMLPFLCITAAVSVMTFTNRLAPRLPFAAGWISAAVAVLIALPSIHQVIVFDSLLAKTDTRVLAARWLIPRVQSMEWVSETPGKTVYQDWGKPPALRIAHFDAQRQLFVSEAGEVVIPEWIVLSTSPLSVYTTVPAGLRPIIDSSYSAVATFAATTAPENSSAFDQQDKFFLPYVGFDARVRPGPEIQIYRRVAAPR
jgi:4-amino-4-deoxy-L-arabinose transferase-like glycosyltransferase